MPEVDKEYSESDLLESPAWKALRKYVSDRRTTAIGKGRSFEEHEQELHRLFSNPT
jgi:hypothetical protein